ncbi:dynein axonemal intermediate chain 3-like, partial [Augochlora pura]
EPNSDEDTDEGVESRTESERNDDERSRGRSDARSTESEDELREKTPLDLFLEARSPEMIDIVKYNAAVNLHVDDIENLSRRANRDGDESADAEAAPIFRELASFVDPKLVENRAVSDISLHPQSTEYVAISYVTNSARPRSFRPKKSGVLIWRFDDPLVHSLELQHHREVSSVSFCPHNDGIVIGGCSTGLVVVWNIKDRSSDDRKIDFTEPRREKPPVVRASMISDERCSHRLAVRRIEWLPAEYRIGPAETTGKQFLTASEDGTVAVWNLPPLPSSSPASDDAGAIDSLLPTFRLRVAATADKPQSFGLLSVCLTTIRVEEPDENAEEPYSWLDAEKNDRRRCLWLGCVEGLVRCGWDEQMVVGETSSVAQCEVLSSSYVHDGPVTDILRSPHLRDVLLTIGGHVFAVWKDDYPKSPLFWRRRTGCRYTACCWASEPGVFLLGDRRGELELWDIGDRPSEPIFARVVSATSIARLISMSRFVKGERVDTIGVGDAAGFFREFKTRDAVVGRDETLERMDRFEEYARREARRKKLFDSWQNDFLANDPAVVARRSARCDEERRKELEEARIRLRKENEERARMRAEKRARAAPKSAVAVWKSKEYRRMKTVLLGKKNLDPNELEKKRLPLVLSNTERDAKLRRARDRSQLAETQLSNALAAEFAEQFQPINDTSETGESTVRFAKPVDEIAKKFLAIREKALRTLAE